MLAPVNRLRIWCRKKVAHTFNRRIRGTPKAKGFAREIPWLKYFIPLDQHLMLARSVPIDEEPHIVTRARLHMYEIYFVDEYGEIMTYMSTNRNRRENRVFDVLMDINESKNFVRFMVVVERNYRSGSRVTLYKFPKDRPAGGWVRAYLANQNLTDAEYRKRERLIGKEQFHAGEDEARKALSD